MKRKKLRRKQLSAFISRNPSELNENKNVPDEHLLETAHCFYCSCSHLLLFDSELFISEF